MQPGMAAKPLRRFALADRNDGIVLLFHSRVPSEISSPFTAISVRPKLL